MGFWAGIKHALNSTLGTEGFKPLDKMILGMRSLKASDEVYIDLKPLDTFPVNLGTEDEFLSEEAIRPYTSGSLKIRITYKPGGSGYGGSTNRFEVLVNGNAAVAANLETSKTSGDLTLDTGIIRYNAGDTISFRSIVSAGPYQSLNFKCKGLYVLGTLTEYQALDIITL